MYIYSIMSTIINIVAENIIFCQKNIFQIYFT